MNKIFRFTHWSTILVVVGLTLFFSGCKAAGGEKQPTLTPAVGQTAVQEKGQTPGETPLAGQTASPGASQTPGQPIQVLGTPRAKIGQQCLQQMIQRGRPKSTKDLTIYVQVPADQPDQVLSVYNGFAQDCDGILFLGQHTLGQNWQDIINHTSKGVIVWLDPSLQNAEQTANEWVDSTDMFAYAIELGTRTPSVESQDPAQSAKQAADFAKQHNLVYIMDPSLQMGNKSAALLAQGADIFLTQNYGYFKQDPQGLAPYIINIDQQIRAVNPNMILFITLGVNLPEYDPQQMYNAAASLIGHIDGVGIATQNSPDAIDKLNTLIKLLRGQ